MPDCILMDIYMPGKLGTEASRELRSMGSNGIIIFLTSSREHALDAFGVDASQYLVKPITEETLFPVLDRILEDMEEARRKYLLLRIDGRIQRVAVDEIVYCEAEGKTQCLYLSNGEQYGLRRTMAEIYGKLLCSRFAGRGCLHRESGACGQPECAGSTDGYREEDLSSEGILPAFAETVF